MTRFEERLKLLAPAPASDALRARIAHPEGRRRSGWSRMLPMGAAAAGLIAALALVIARGPFGTPAQPNEAEREFRRMERTLLEARSIRVSFKRVSELATQKGGFEQLETSGLLQLKEGSRLNLTCTHTNAPGKPFAFTTTWTFLCDGSAGSTRMKSPQGTKTLETIAIHPKDLNEKLLLALSRKSLAVPEAILPLDLADVKSSLELSDFAFGIDESGGRILTYRVGGFDAKLWTDPVTGLPLKRTFGRKEFGTFVETYERLEINPQLDDGLFQIPADK